MQTKPKDNENSRDYIGFVAIKKATLLPCIIVPKIVWFIYLVDMIIVSDHYPFSCSSGP